MHDPRDKPMTVVMVLADGRERIVGRVCARAVDLATIDGLLRLQLLAQRRGWRLQVRDASDDLRALLELVGLEEVLVLEPRRQPEVGEPLRVDEVVQPRDPLA